MKIQLNHPGKQKRFKIGNGYIRIGSNIIREWNNDNVHYRKFIQNKGYYLDNLRDSSPKYEDLYFWGEWEGNSFFTPFAPTSPNFKIFPNGIHRPFHSTVIRGNQNTDPYIFGKDFKYCICQQTGKMLNLQRNDLILFGTVYPSLNKFYIDTIFVVKYFIPSTHVQDTKGVCYSQVYIEETLEQLNEYLRPPIRTNNPHKIYHSKTWWDDKEYFSFVPCKLSPGQNGFERLYIFLDNTKFQLSRNPRGKCYLINSPLNSRQLWREVVELCQQQGFKLGIKFDEPQFDNCLNHLKNYQIQRNYRITKRCWQP